MVGRTLDAKKLDLENLDLENLDLVTAEIYTAAVDAGIDIHAVMTAEAGDVATVLEGKAPWMGDCARVLAKLRRKVPESPYYRILEVWTGSKKDALSDPDAQVCLEYATFFFDDHVHDVDALVDLATCLLDYAFTRQGLDDELARVTKREPAYLQKALERAGGGKKELEVSFSPNVQEFDTHLKAIQHDLFVVAVKRALRSWKPRLVRDIIKMHPDTVYRVAMVHTGHPTGDPLVRKVYTGALRHKGEHPSNLVTIGHAALSLEVLMARRGILPTDHGIVVVKEFCRSCGSGLQHPPHGCCMTDRMTQATELQALARRDGAVQQLQDLWSTAPSISNIFPHRQHLSSRHPSSRQPRYQQYNSYELRTTPLLDGSPDKLEVHLDIWDDGIWQEVPSLEAADRLATRALQEAERARALVRPGDTTRVVGTVSTANVNLHSTATAGPMSAPTIEQLIVCKFPTCSKFATRSRGRYCPHHAEEMRHVDNWLEAQEELGSSMAKALEESVKELPQQSTALAKMLPKEEALELRQLNSQTNFGKSLRWLAIVLGGVALGLTKSLLVLPFIAVAWVMAYAFIDHRAIEAQKRRALEEKSS
jgi:hypothetical protein